jgi:phosphoglycolate phosphatase
MLKKVVFDFDGTLADSFTQMIGLIKEIRPGITENDIEIYRNEGARSFQKKIKMSMIELVRLVKKLKIEHGKIIEEARAFPEIKEMIVGLRERGIEVGILSSNNKDNIEKWLDKTGIKVDWIVSESNLFGKNLAIGKVKSDDMIYVGDEVRDVDACKKARVKIVAVAWGFNTKKALENAGADYVVESVIELRNLLFTFSQ